jgi:hypothetical protein
VLNGSPNPVASSDMLSYIPERNPGLVNSVKKHSMIPAFFVDI